VLFAGVACHLSRSQAKSEEPQSLEQVLHKGMEIQARVLDIDFANGGKLMLVSKSDELARDTFWEEEYLHSVDQYYYVISNEERNKIEKAKKVCMTAALS
jgi:hypothetical protein